MKMMLKIMATVVVFALIIMVIGNLLYKPKVKPVKDKVYASQYLMIDDSCRVHIPSCVMIKYKENLKVRYVDTTDVYKEQIEWFCPTCIGVKEYDHIKRLMRKTKKTIEGF